MSRCIDDYDEKLNNLIGAYYSSRLSPWLANGSLSCRLLYHEVKRYESTPRLDELDEGFDINWKNATECFV